MWTNYLLLAKRNLFKNKAYSALNIAGLAMGMAVALLIGLWLHYQLTYDHFLPAYNQAYQVKTNSTTNGETITSTANPLPLAAAIKNEVPGILYAANTDWMGGHSLIVGDKKLFINGAIADNDFLRIFQFPFASGNIQTAIRDPYAIILTQSLANSLFGNDNPIGKTVRFDNTHDMVVSAVLKDLPTNSTFQFKFIVPFAYALQQYDYLKHDIGNWRDNDFPVFVALAPGVTAAQVAPALNSLFKKYNPVDYKTYQTTPFLQAFKDVHLYSDFRNGKVAGGFIEYVRMFGIIGALVLLIACINFVNLSTARSKKRATEVGIRKAIGSQRRQLILQFLTESLLYTFISFLLALLITWVALPSFNTLTGVTLHIPFDQWEFWATMLVYVTMTGLLAGARPAFYLSSFRPVKVLKGQLHEGREAALPRKVLVVIQFTCSIALIISTLIVYQQIQHAKDRPTGYDFNRLMMTDANNDLTPNYTALKDEMLRSGVVTSVTKSSSPVTDIWSNQRVDDWEGKQPGEGLGLSTVGVSDADYFKTLGMHFVQGRNFTGDEGADSLNVILNEAAVKRMRYQAPLGQVITWHDIPQRVRVIGVVNNTLMSSPFAPVEPMIFIYSPSWSNSITYRLSPNVTTSAALVKLKPIFEKYNPLQPYGYSFVNESYASKFGLEMLIGKLAALFAGLTVFISCLGLFGLTAYMAEQRMKEIGIRKVLGASLSQIWWLLSTDFLWLVFMSCLIASPIALYFLQGWLQHYEYRIHIGPGMFFLASIVSLALTVITISFQTLKAGSIAPVKSLQNE